MSDPTNPAPGPAPSTITAPASGSTPLEQAADIVSQLLPIAEAVADVAFPGAGTAVSTGIKIAAGVIAKIPEAEALWNQFQSGTAPTQEQLDAYMKGEESSYEKLMADIKAARASA